MFEKPKLKPATSKTKVLFMASNESGSFWCVCKKPYEQETVKPFCFGSDYKLVKSPDLLNSVTNKSRTKSFNHALFMCLSSTSLLRKYAGDVYKH